jgi:hypothetical protein
VTRNKDVVIAGRIKHWITVGIRGHFISTGASLNSFNVVWWIDVVVKIDNDHFEA